MNQPSAIHKPPHQFPLRNLPLALSVALGCAIWLITLAVHNDSLFAPITSLPAALAGRFTSVVQAYWWLAMTVHLISSAVVLRKQLNILELGAVLSFEIGIYGVFTGNPGWLMGALLITLLLNGWNQYRSGEKPFVGKHLLVVGAAALYVLYEAGTLLWTPNLSASWSWFRLELWILVIAAATCCFGIPRALLHRMVRAALDIFVLYVVALLFIYGSMCTLLQCSPLIGFTLNKFYIPGPLGDLAPQVLLLFYSHNHYSLMGVVIFLLLTYAIFHKRTVPEPFLWLSLFSFGLYAMILQSRISMLFCVLTICYRLVGYYPYSHLLRFLGSLLMPILSLLPFSLHYFADPVRTQAKNLAYKLLEDKSHLWSGYGLGTARDLIAPYQQGSNPSLQHFHNQYLQSLVEGGIPLFVCLILFLGSIAWVAWQKKAWDVGAALLILLFVMSVDILFFLTQYLIPIWLLLFLMLAAYPKTPSHHTSAP